MVRTYYMLLEKNICGAGGGRENIMASTTKDRQATADRQHTYAREARASRERYTTHNTMQVRHEKKTNEDVLLCLECTRERIANNSRQCRSVLVAS